MVLWLPLVLVRLYCNFTGVAIVPCYLKDGWTERSRNIHYHCPFGDCSYTNRVIERLQQHMNKTHHTGTGRQGRQEFRLRTDNESLYVKCCQCQKNILKSNIESHKKKVHKKKKKQANRQPQLHANCIMPSGLFLVRRSAGGNSHPVHCMKSQTTDCEMAKCEVGYAAAKASSMPAWECLHCTSATNTLYKRRQVTSLNQDTFENANVQLLCSKETIDSIKVMQENAEKDQVPFIFEFEKEEGSEDKNYYVSVYTGNKTHYSKFKRTVVYVDEHSHFHCRCRQSRKSCLHKRILQCWLIQEGHRCVQNLIQNESDDEESDGEFIDDDVSEVLSAGCTIHDIRDYQMKHKRIPIDIPESCLGQKMSFFRNNELQPSETECHRCGTQLNSVVQNRNATLILHTKPAVLKGKGQLRPPWGSMKSIFAIF